MIIENGYIKFKYLMHCCWCSWNERCTHETNVHTHHSMCDCFKNVRSNCCSCVCVCYGSIVVIVGCTFQGCIILGYNFPNYWHDEWMENKRTWTEMPKHQANIPLHSSKCLLIVCISNISTSQDNDTSAKKRIRWVYSLKAFFIDSLFVTISPEKSHRK